MVVTLLPLAHAFQWFFLFFTFALVSIRFAMIGGNLTAQSTGNHWGIAGGIQIPVT